MSFVPAETVIVTDEKTDEELLRRALPGAATTVVSLAQGVPQVLRQLEERQPALIVLACDHSSNEGLELLREARKRHDGSAIVVVYAGSPNGFMERAFQLGVDDLITLPQSSDALAFAFEKAVTRRRGSAPATLSPLICIVGPKGGTGKTLTACNLGVALALAGARPAIVDIDLQFGDVGLALGLRPENTIYDLVLSGATVDAATVSHFLTRHSSGLNVLLAPIRPDQAGAIRPDFLRQVYSALREEHDFVIVDTPPSFTSEVIATIDAATDLCVVGMLDALSLKDTKIGLETLGLMGCDLDEVTLVLNRADTNVGISMRDVERLLGRVPDVLVPSNRAIPRAITDGEPIVVADEASPAARAFTKLASSYLQNAGMTGPDEDARSRGRKSLLRKGR